MRRKNIDKCRNLRRNQTDSEKKLWSILRNRKLTGIKFRRQFSVGPYILDFYSPEYKLCIEADGGQHFEDAGLRKDEIRTKYLNRCGIRVLRFSDVEILKNTEGIYTVLKNIFIEMNVTPHPASPRRGEVV